MREIRINRKPYGGGTLFHKETYTFEPGITMLAGCNGIGKSTLLRRCFEELRHGNVPVLHLRGLRDEGIANIEHFTFFKDWQGVADSFVSSEGENLMIALDRLAPMFGRFVKEGIVPGDVRSSAARQKLNESKERWFLIDAADSGLSPDRIVELKDFLRFVLTDARDTGMETYILVAANAYETVRGERCMDVREGKYVDFPDYESFREFIMRSREARDARNTKKRGQGGARRKTEAK